MCSYGEIARAMQCLSQRHPANRGSPRPCTSTAVAYSSVTTLTVSAWVRSTRRGKHTVCNPRRTALPRQQGQTQTSLPCPPPALAAHPSSPSFHPASDASSHANADQNAVRGTCGTGPARAPCPPSPWSPRARPASSPRARHSPHLRRSCSAGRGRFHACCSCAGGRGPRAGARPPGRWAYGSEGRGGGGCGSCGGRGRRRRA